ERRWEPKLPFARLADVSNAMAKVHLAHIPTDNAAIGEGWTAFCYAALRQGLEEAASHLPEAKRPSWRAKLKVAQGAFWRKAEFWKKWPVALERDGLMAWINRAKAAKPTWLLVRHGSCAAGLSQWSIPHQDIRQRRFSCLNRVGFCLPRR